MKRLYHDEACPVWWGRKCDCAVSLDNTLLWDERFELPVYPESDDFRVLDVEPDPQLELDFDFQLPREGFE